MYLGIDLGTSSVKMVIFDEQHEIIAQDSQPLTVSQPHPLWSEQNPEDWWQATSKGVSAIKQKVGKKFADLKAIGLSGQQHGATLIDRKGQVLRPAMLWNDGRAMEQCHTLANKIPTHMLITGNSIMPGFTAPKVLWVKENEAEAFAKTHKVLLPKDYLRLRLTGEYATDLSDASGTGWLDVQNRRWSDDMLSGNDFTQKNMPELFEGSQITATVSKAIAEEWGISHHTVVAAGGGDNPAGAISVNVIKPGSAFLSLGTSGVYFVASNEYHANPKDGVHTFCHCLPQQWHHMSVHLSSASSLSWLANSLNANVGELLHEAEHGVHHKTQLIFLPYLSGERTPHINPYAKGVFFGMTTNTSRADLVRAVLEGVAFSFADGQSAMTDAGVKINDVAVVGGGSQSLYWGKILASTLQRPLTYRRNREVGSALGAARLAWLATNPCDPQTAFTSPAIECIVEPDSALQNQYVQKRETYRELYRRLSDMFITL